MSSIQSIAKLSFVLGIVSFTMTTGALASDLTKATLNIELRPSYLDDSVPDSSEKANLDPTSYNYDDPDPAKTILDSCSHLSQDD